MSPLATLGQVKAKLDLMLTDSSQDAGVQAALDAAGKWFLEQCKYDLTAAAHTDRLFSVNSGRLVKTSFRPVAAVTSVEGRLAGGAAASLAFDLIDPEKGKLYIGSSADSWPPAPRLRRRSDYVWDVVEILYTTDALLVTEDISDVVAALAATWYTADRSLAREQVDVGIVRERYRMYPIPPWIMERLNPHLRRVTRWVR